MKSGRRTDTAPSPAAPLLGTGHGLDHILVVTKDLAAASHDYRERLGFTLVPGSRFSSGVENEAISLHEREYLELLAIYNRETGHPDISEIEQFLSKGEGLIGFGIRVSSAEETASYLRRGGFEAKGPSPGTTSYPGIEEAPPVLWKYVQVKTGQKYIDDVIFFVEYVEGAYAAFRSRHPELPDPDAAPPTHRNSAFGGLHPWLAVAELQQASATYEKVGFPRIRRVKFERLKGDAVEVRVGQNSLLIVGHEAAGGPIEDFLRERESPFGLMGMSLGVRSVAKAIAAIQPHVAAGLEPYVGLFGKSIVIPPESAHGAWLELFEADS